MTFTDDGAKIVGRDWLPLAAANGAGWAARRQGQADRFDNLYRFRRAPICWLLWMAGALAAALGFDPFRSSGSAAEVAALEGRSP